MLHPSKSHACGDGSPFRGARPLLTFLAIALLSTGCCSFEREWRNANSYAYPAHEVAGVWEGRWCSNHNGHNGTLRAIITKEGENYYHAHFKATWAYIIPFEFELPLTTCSQNGCETFSGSADLGFLAGGTFQFSGSACGSTFDATFCANKDHGVFNMTRVSTLPQCCNAVCTQHCDPNCAPY